MRILAPAIISFSFSLLYASEALADPCKAIPDRGPLPSYLSRGSQFSGAITYIGDGDNLCVAVGNRPDQWVEVRVADYYAPASGTREGERTKAALTQVAKGKVAVCIARRAI